VQVKSIILLNFPELIRSTQLIDLSFTPCPVFLISGVFNGDYQVCVPDVCETL
jgi:hypothetical protein